MSKAQKIQQLREDVELLFGKDINRADDISNLQDQIDCIESKLDLFESWQQFEKEIAGYKKQKPDDNFDDLQEEYDKQRKAKEKDKLLRELGDWFTHLYMAPGAIELNIDRDSRIDIIINKIKALEKK